MRLFGKSLSLPVLIGPTGLAGLFWPRGEIASARAAAAASTVYCLSHGSVCSIEDLAAQHRGPRWMQVFIYRDRAFTRELTQRARDAGYEALVLTIDNQLLGKRERDLANGFSIPPRFSGRQSLAMAAKWRWGWSMRRELRALTFGNYVRPGSSESLATLAGRMGSLLDPAMCWDDVAQLRADWQGPLLLKGILHPAEARRAVELGIDGLIVSNHGGRQLDGAASPLDALPAIVAAIEDRVPVLIDGGIRRGSDVVKAIALGARAVLIARPQLWGLAVAGEAGVAHVLAIYRSEIDRVMGLARREQPRRAAAARSAGPHAAQASPKADAKAVPGSCPHGSPRSARRRERDRRRCNDPATTAADIAGSSPLRARRRPCGSAAFPAGAR